jgi:hypothetical protein
VAVYHRYVNADLGDDGNDGLSAGSAWATLIYAVSQSTITLGDVWVLHLKGIFDHSATQITAAARNGSPLCFVVDAPNDATITLSPTTTTNLFSTTPGYLVLDGIIFQNAWWSTINLGQYSTVVNCVFRGRPSANGSSSYSLNMTGGNIYGCRFEGTGVGVAGLTIENCDFVNLAGASGTTSVYTGHSSQVNRCRFVGRGISGSNSYGATIRNCSIHGASTGISIAAFTMGLVVQNNVFSNCTTNIGTIGAWYKLANNYTFGETTEGPTAGSGAYNEGFTSLNAAPYADPANEVWTPSAELSAISDNGYTPGAIQAVAASGGTAGFTGIRGVSRRLGT